MCLWAFYLFCCQDCDQFTFCCSGLRSVYLLLFRFAINFFTSIGLGGLTEDLRTHLKAAPKPTAVVAPVIQRSSRVSARIPVLLTLWPRVRNGFFPDLGSPTHIFESLLTTAVVAPVIQRSSRVSAVYPCCWPLDPGFGIDFFRIPDPQPIFLRAYWQPLSSPRSSRDPPGWVPYLYPCLRIRNPMPFLISGSIGFFRIKFFLYRYR